MGNREDLEIIKKEFDDIKEKSFALEILQDYKKANKRQFIIILILIFTWIITLGLAAYYINTTGFETITESTEVENESGTANACVGDNCNNGEVIYGESKSNKNN
jgi:hypothetical protein